MGKREREHDLALLTRSVMRQLALDPESHPLHVLATDGSRPVVFALENELLSVVTDRVVTAGGAATIFVGMKNGKVTQVSGRPSPTPSGRAEELGTIPSSITIGMFITILGSSDGPVRFRVALPDDSGTLAVGDLVGAGSWAG